MKYPRDKESIQKQLMEEKQLRKKKLCFEEKGKEREGFKDKDQTFSFTLAPLSIVFGVT